MKKFTESKRAFVVYVLGNFVAGMLFVLMISPEFFNKNILMWYITIPLDIVFLGGMFKINYDGYKYGLVEGAKRNC